MNGSSLFRDVPVRRKLILIALVSMGAGTFFAMALATVQQWAATRAEMVSIMGNYAELIAKNNTSALLAGDRKAATQTAGALAAVAEIEFAEIHDKNNQSFASYVRPGGAPIPDHTVPMGHRHVFSAAHLDLFRPIVSGGTQIGTIHLRASLAPLYEKMLLNMAALLATMLGGLGLAWGLIARLHPIITRPIAELMGLMDRVSREKNYALRVLPGGKDELSALTEEFNGMLEQIQVRENALAQHSAHLEQEVSLRTASLNDAQRIAHLGSWDWNIVNDTLNWSDEIYRIFGLTPQQFGASYEAFLQAVHPQDRQRVADGVREALEQSRPYNIDHRIVLPDGTVRHVHERAEVSRGKNGQPIGMVGTVHDITDRKLAEQALEASEHKLRAIIDASADGIMMADVESSTFVLGSQAMCDKLGYRQDEIIQLKVADLHPSEAWPEVQRQFEKQLKGDIKTAPNMPVKRKDGSLFFADVSVSTMTLAGRLYVVGVFHDVTENKMTEEAMRKANIELSLYRTLLDHSSDAIEVMDPATLRLLDVNERACRDLGYSREELLSMTIFDIDPGLTPAAIKMIEAQTQEPGIARFEGIHRRKDGSTFPVEVSSSFVVLDKPYALNMIRDITERKQVEEQIRKQQELTTQIIENIPMRVFWKDRALRYQGCNTVFARDAGENDPDKLIGKDDFQINWREQAETYRADDQRVMDSNTPKLSYDEPQTTPTGEHIWLRTSKVPLRNEAHEVIGVLGTYEDITERKNMEISLRDSEARYRNIFEFVDDIIFTLASDGTLSSLNPAFERTTGWLPSKWIGKPFSPLVYPDDLLRIQAVFKKLQSGETLPAFQMRLVTKAGTYLDSEIAAAAIRRGDSTTIFGILRDITERKRVDEQIRQLNEELEIKVKERTRQLLDAQEELLRKEKLAVLGQMAGSVGHELRNPLAVMSNAVYFLQTVMSDADATTREYLGIIKNEITVSERIVSDLLDSVRTKSPQPQALGVRELIEQVLGKCPIPPSVTVKLDIPAAIPPLRVDSMQIHQVLRNLISNGVEAMPEGGHLEIRATENTQAKTITISVRDTGTGMTPEHLAKLFQPLFTTKAHGIGLGLVVVKNLTQANGGKVDVVSKPGTGTTFRVTLPSDTLQTGKA